MTTEYKILEYTDEQENNPFRVWFFDLNVRSKRYKNSQKKMGWLQNQKEIKGSL